MRYISLDLRKFTSEKEAYRILKRKFDFPDYFGGNLDALHDCLTDIASDTEVTLLYRGAEAEGCRPIVSVLLASVQENAALSTVIK